MENTENKNLIEEFKKEVALKQIRERYPGIDNLINIAYQKSSGRSEAAYQLLSALIKLENNYSENEYIYHKGSYFRYDLSLNLLDSRFLNTNYINVVMIPPSILSNNHMILFHEMEGFKRQRDFLFVAFVLSLISIFLLLPTWTWILTQPEILFALAVVGFLLFLVFSRDKTRLLKRKYDKTLKKLNKLG